MKVFIEYEMVFNLVLELIRYVTCFLRYIVRNFEQASGQLKFLLIT